MLIYSALAICQLIFSCYTDCIDANGADRNTNELYDVYYQNE